MKKIVINIEICYENLEKVLTKINDILEKSTKESKFDTNVEINIEIL